jgi:endonuclease YncB( thermonuclease family)
MSFAFPQFQAPTAIDPQRSWTATYDSYDQRNDDVYYVVTVHEAGRDVARFMVQAGLYWAGDDWTGPGFVERLHEEIHKVAATGETNTSHTGTMTRI